MAVNLAPKQGEFSSAYAAALVALLGAADTLTGLNTQWGAMSYGTGGTNAITDAAVQAVLPGATAVQLNAAQFATAGSGLILAVIAANRGALEPLRP